MQIDGAAYFTRKARPGSIGYEPEPGEVRVRDDRDPQAPALFYRVPRGLRRAFRAWVRATWAQPGERVRLRGGHPDIAVDG